jgi:hypothetical protein
MGPSSQLREIVRLVPAEPLPPYSYVTGLFPHPTGDPAGHSFSRPPEHPAAPDASRWNECRPYLYGLDLFNHGYYWEAHEVWEGLWHACGRGGTTGTFLKGLIKLAAAGVKARERRPQGVQRHAHRARELFQQTASQLGPGHCRYMGLMLRELIGFATDLIDRPLVGTAEPGTPVEVVFPFVLRPL